MSHRKTAIPADRIIRGLFGAAALGACAFLMLTNSVGCSSSEDMTGTGGSTGAAGQGPAGATGSGHGGTTGGGEGGHVVTGGEGGHVAAGEGGTTGSGRGGGNAAGGRGGGNAAGGRAGGNAAGGHAGGTAAGGSGGGGDATFAAVAQILMSSCTASKCHDGASGNAKTDLRNNSGLYMRLVNAAQSGEMGTACNGKILVVPSQPTMSLLYQKVSGTGIPNGCGDRMPDGCPTKASCLTSAQIATIQAWIAAGAPM
jgi:hypothetical protein